VEGQAIEAQPVLVQAGGGQVVVVVSETQFQEGVLPLRVEEERAFDVDQNGFVVLVEQDVIGAELAVDQAEVGAGS
jgi:hypothetical protein